jgi:hypothetical protein
MHSVGVAAPRAALDMSARAPASRINGAKSRGPTTPEGKARSSQNALKHGLCAERFVVAGDEGPQAFAALESALEGELAPDGTLQRLLAGRIARAAWRLERADRIEAELFAHEIRGDGDLGMALIRDGHGARAFQTLLRYRGVAQAELWRALRMLKALQAEAALTQARAELGQGVPPPTLCRRRSRHATRRSWRKSQRNPNPAQTLMDFRQHAARRPGRLLCRPR